MLLELKGYVSGVDRGSFLPSDAGNSPEVSFGRVHYEHGADRLLFITQFLFSTTTTTTCSSFRDAIVLPTILDLTLALSMSRAPRPACIASVYRHGRCSNPPREPCCRNRTDTHTPWNLCKIAIIYKVPGRTPSSASDHR